MPAALTIGALNTAPVNTYAVEVPYTLTAPGASVQRQAVELAAPGASKHFAAVVLRAPGGHRIASRVYYLSAPGVRWQLNTFIAPAPGRYNIAIIPARLSAPGVARQYQTVAVDAPGVAAQRQAFAVDVLGLGRIQLPFEVDAPGRYVRGLGHDITAPGRHNIAQPLHTRVYRQGYRVADASLDTMLLWVGYGAMPVLTDAPVATGDPATFNPTLPDPGETTVLHIVACKRNAYGLKSFNQQPVLLEINEYGEEELGPLTAPELVRVLDGSGAGDLQAWGRYAYAVDRNPADVWELYAEEGVDPVPGVDTPVATGTISGFGRTGAERRLTAALTPGSTYHVRVAVKRTADSLRAASVVEQITLLAVYAVDANDVSMFGGEEYEINQ